MAFRVILSRRAEADVAEAITWRLRTSFTAAVRWRTGLFRLVESLEADPTQHAAAPEGADLGIDLRQLLYGRRRNIYRILFTIDGQTVNVLRVRHAAQDYLSPEDV